jgi:ribosomal protein L37AE/L43A
MSTLTYKCPSCGAPLIYRGDTQTLHCDSCGNSFSGETVRQVSEIEQAQGKDSISWDMHDAEFSQQEAERTKTYSCTSCGAQLMTEETTVATNCAFCGSPSVIPAQFTPGTRPERVIPFIVKKEEAEKAFHNYFRGKRMLPDAFLKGKNQISQVMQLYVPFWLFNCTAHADMTFNGTRVNTRRSGQYMETITQHYLIRRAGTVDFKDLPIDANSRIENDITETLEPYKTDDSINFSPEVLSGAMANRADVSPEECKRRADQRISITAQNTMRDTIQGYTSVSQRSSKLNIPQGTSTPVLFPMWQITTIKDGKPYTFAINGQTGKLTTNIPYSKGKFISWALGIAVSFAAFAFAGMTILYKLGVMK